MIYAKDKEQAYRTVPEGTYYYGITLVDGDIYRVLMWNYLLGIEGTDRIVKMTVRLFDSHNQRLRLHPAHPRREAAPNRHPHPKAANG